MIQRYSAILGPKKVGVGECVFAHVSLTRHSKPLSQEFADLMLARQKVMECYIAIGEADIVLRVATPRVSAYDEFLANIIFGAQGVSQVHSNFALRQIRYETALPLEK